MERNTTYPAPQAELTGKTMGKLEVQRLLASATPGLRMEDAFHCLKYYLRINVFMTANNA